MDEQLSAVPDGSAKREREVAPRWVWTEPSVWTERMLNALEKGVKGGKWYSLSDKVYAEETLQAGWRAVKRNGKSGGVDGQTIAQFERDVEKWITHLYEQIRTEAYEPLPVRRVFIPKPGSHELRPLGIPSVRDRIVQSALRCVIEPIFEKKFRGCSYGFRPKRSAKDALREVQRHLDAGRVWVVDVDIQRYFDTIPHRRLMQEIETEIADRRVLKLIEAYLKQGVMEGHKELRRTRGGNSSGRRDQSPVGEHLPASVRCSDGAGRVRLGALRGRLRGDVWHAGRGGTCARADSRADRGSRADAASGENEARRRHGAGRVRFPRIPLRARATLPAQEECAKAQRHDQGADAANEWAQPSEDH